MYIRVYLFYLQSVNESTPLLRPPSSQIRPNRVDNNDDASSAPQCLHYADASAQQSKSVPSLLNQHHDTGAPTPLNQSL